MLPTRLPRSAWLRAAVLCACLAPPAGAQTARAPDPTLARSLGLDFAVPESPAFDLLAIEPSAILRPTSVKELTAAISGLVGDGTAISIPRQFGVEFAPALLIGGRNLSLKSYRAQPWLYRLRVSGAASRPDSGTTPTMLAVGVRASLVDRSDPRMNAAYLRAVEAMHLRRVRDLTAVSDSLVKLGMLPPGRVPAEATDLVTAFVAGPERADSVLQAWGVPGDRKAEILALIRRLRVAGMVDRSELDALHDEFEDATWNATTFDVALAARADAQNPDGGTPELRRWAAWATLGLPLGRTGQVLLGARGSLEHDSTSGDWDPAGTFSSRVYFGDNDIKFLLEVQGKFGGDADPVWLASSGGEFRTPLGPWLRFTAGLERDEQLNRSRLTSNVSLGLGLSGLFP
jgi:hypothetical protein